MTYQCFPIGKFCFSLIELHSLFSLIFIFLFNKTQTRLKQDASESVYMTKRFTMYHSLCTLIRCFGMTHGIICIFHGQ